ncbi:hypothetical protein OFB78_29160, partial [Escherichia coli]|nr:hypothetical protein [Escherichia coli]
VRKELRRVRYLREYFETQRLSPNSNSAPLVVLLDDSRRRWKEQAIKNSKAALAELAQPNCYHKPLLQRNRSLLLQVQPWPTQPAENQQTEEELDPEHYIDGLGAPDDSTADKPSDP